MEIVDVKTINESNKKRRFAVDYIKDFIDNDKNKEGRVVVLYGLRRTGKTTMMNQIIEDYRDSIKCAFIQVKNTDTMNDIYLKLVELRDEGVKIVCLDEITNAEDFIENSAALADIFAKDGMKIILAGTDSLGFNFSVEKSLFDRTFWIETTYIPYAEHSYVLGTTDIDDYIKYGGLMREGILDNEIHSYETAKRYLEGAVASNIANSISKDYYSNTLEDLTKQDLQIIISKMVEIYSGSFKKEQIENELKNVSINKPLHLLLNKIEYKNIIKLVIAKEEDIAREFSKIIGTHRALHTRITTDMIIALQDYLFDINVLSATQTKTIISNDDLTFRNQKIKNEFYIIQPAIKYHHLKEGLKFIDNDPFYVGLKTLSGENNFISELKTKLKEQTKGDMIEQIVLFDVKESLKYVLSVFFEDEKKYETIKVKFSILENTGEYNNGEYDILVRNIDLNAYYAFEVKHTFVPCINQAKHLENEKITKIANDHFGKRLGSAVLYRGNSFKSDTGTIYLNISDFLIAVNKYKNMELAMDELTKNLEVKSIEQDENSDDDYVDSVSQQQKFRINPRTGRREIIE